MVCAEAFRLAESVATDVTASAVNLMTFPDDF
jgi:hypothetical protein